jgi:general secretion pathway protein H
MSLPSARIRGFVDRDACGHGYGRLLVAGNNRHHTKSSRSSQRGLTLVEVLVVLVLVALMGSAAVLGAGSIGSSRLRAAAATVVAYSRVAVTRTNATGRPVRIVFDLEKGQIWVEESTTSRGLRASANPSKQTDKASSDDEYQGPDAERARAAKAAGDIEAEHFIEGKGKQRSNFQPIRGLEIAGESVGEQRDLGRSIEYHQVQTEHDADPHTEGRAYLYFWPGGETEWASVQLRRSGEKSSGLTVLVSPLTGRARIESGYVDLPRRNREGDISELEGES